MTSSFMIPLGKSHHNNYNFKDITSLSSSIKKKKKITHCMVDQMYQRVNIRKSPGQPHWTELLPLSYSTLRVLFF